MAGKNTIPPIKEFPDDGHTWRIDWLGRLLRNQNIPDEPLIEVLVSPLKKDTLRRPKELAGIGAVEREQRSIYVGTGQLPYLKIGSLWEKRRCLKALAGEIYPAKNVVISQDTVQVIKANQQVSGGYLIPSRFYYLGKGLDSFCLAVRYENDDCGLVIPAIEILRFYYATSSTLSRALFTGTVWGSVDSLLDENGCSLNGSTARLLLNKRALDSDCWTMARLLFAPEARGCVESLWAGIVRQHTRGAPLIPTACLPFSGQTNLRVRVKPIQSGDGVWRRLVLGIEQCSAPFPCAGAVIERIYDNRKATGEDLSEEKIPMYWGANVQHSENEQLQSQEEATRLLQAVSFQSIEDRFPFLHGRFWEKEDKEFCQYRNLGRNKEKAPEPSGDLSTGGGGYGQGGIAPGTIAVRQRQQGVPADFEHFKKLIAAIDRIKSFEAEIRQLSDDNAFIPVRKGKKSQWGYIKNADYSRRRRDVLVGDITHDDGRVFALVEFAHGKNEHYTMGLLCSQDGEFIHDGWLSGILLGLAEARGVWKNIKPKYLTGVTLKTVAHKVATVEKLARLVAIRIQKD